MIGPGAVLADRYKVVRHLGSGGMASVFLAEDSVLGRSVAVKRLHAAPDTDFGRRIKREARLGAGARHANLVTVYDVVPDGEALLLVMEYVAGETLADTLKRGPLAPDRALPILRQVADALDHLHEHGVVHRDVKPANILLGERGAVKLSDLGVATSADVTQITHTGGVIGTAAYMAPEQFESAPAGPAADIYALAGVAFETLGGRRAYTSSSPFEVLGRLRDGAAPPDLREVRADTPAEVADVLARGMATDPGERPATARELVDGVERGYGLEAAPEPAPAPETTHPPTEEMPARVVEPEPPAEQPRDATPIPPRAEPDPPVRDEPTAPPRRPQRPAAKPAGPRRRSRIAAPLALLAVAAIAAGAIVAAVLAGSGDEPASDRAQRPATTAERGTRTAPSTTRTQPATASPATPAGAVRAFYERAADGDLAGSWRLAGPRFRQAFGGSQERFRGTLGSLESIEFRRLEETARAGDSATVAIETVARHTDRTDRCTGTLQAVRDGPRRWLVEPQGVSCRSA